MADVLGNPSPAYPAAPVPATVLSMYCGAGDRFGVNVADGEGVWVGVPVDAAVFVGEVVAAPVPVWVPVPVTVLVEVGEPVFTPVAELERVRAPVFDAVTEFAGVLEGTVTVAVGDAVILDVGEPVRVTVSEQPA